MTVRIVDLCPACNSGDLDLSKEAYAEIDDPMNGSTSMSWFFTDCTVTGPIAYHFDPTASEYYLAVQVRNHRYRIEKLEYMESSTSKFVEIPRKTYNYFEKLDGIGPGPFVFRVTDSYGQVLVDKDIPLKPDGDVPGADQFPECAP